MAAGAVATLVALDMAALVDWSGSHRDPQHVVTATGSGATSTTSLPERAAVGGAPSASGGAAAVRLGEPSPAVGQAARAGSTATTNVGATTSTGISTIATTTVAPGPGTTSTTVITTTTRPSTTTVPSTTTAPSTTTGPSTTASPSSTVPASTSGLPAPGTYSYDGSGSEQLLAASRQFPSQSGILVASSGCGESETWEPSPNHTEVLTVCPAPGGLHLASDHVSVSFVGLTYVEDFSCGPSAFLPTTSGSVGDQWTFDCSSSDSTSASSATLVGRGTVSVGGLSVATTHVHVDTTVTGAQDGTETVDYWLAADGTLVEESADVSLSEGTLYGLAKYQASYTLQLASTQPS